MLRKNMKRKKVTDIRNGIVDTVKENKKQSRNVVLVRNVITVKAGALNMQSRSSQGVVTCVMSYRKQLKERKKAGKEKFK